MRSADLLAEFVRDALTQGRSRADIATALQDAGWTRSEITDALGAWSDTAFTPPVPRPRPYLSARDAFFYGLMFVALGMTAFHLVQLCFHLIEMWLPTPLQSDWNRYDRDSMRWSVAALIVFAPLFGLLDRRANRQIAANPGQRRSGVRKWFSYATLFVTALTLLGALFYTVYAFLDGDLTTRLIAKIATLTGIAGAIFLYYRPVVREDDNAHP